MKVLLIEDDRVVVDTIYLVFGVCWPEAELATVELGEMGVAMVMRDEPDIAILDLGLPDLDGLDVLSQIRSFSNIPVAILSARCDPDTISRSFQLGADDYVVKPFDPQDLVSRMKVIIENKQEC